MNKKELHCKGENICKITKLKCHKKTICKDCEEYKEYKKEKTNE